MKDNGKRCKVKVSCLQENLARGLTIVGRAVAARSTLPVVSNVLLATDDSRLKLAATNLEIAITSWTPARVDEEGAITIPARLLNEFVSSLPTEKIDMALNVRTRTLNLKCASYEANIKGIDAEEFPPIPRVSEEATTLADPEQLRAAIGQVAFAAATDDSRPVLAGVLASFEGQTLTLAAADGFRLAVRKVPLLQAVAERVEVVVPGRAMQELARILAEQDEPVQISLTPNKSQVLFRMKDVELVSRLVQGTFPNYQQIIPQRYTTRVVVGTSELAKATKLASFFARDAANVVRVQVTAGEDLKPGKLVVAATAAEVGDTVGGIDAVVEGENVQIAFNAKYLADVLGVLNSNQVALEVTTSSSPGVVKPVGSDDYVHVIMPMHIAR